MSEFYDHTTTPERERLGRLASAWQGRFEEQMQVFYAQGHPTLDGLLDLIWDYAIMARIDPQNQEEKAARIALNKTVWEGTQDDPALYLRLRYSIASAKHHQENNSSIIASSDSLIVPLFQAVYMAAYNRKAHEIFGAETDITNVVLDRLIERVNHKIAELGAEPPTQIIPVGTKGTWKGIPVTIESYAGSGRIILQAESYEGHGELWTLGASNGADPTTFATDFVPDHTEVSS